jgi:hypothetical protein
MARDILLIVDDILRMISVIETAMIGKKLESFEEDVSCGSASRGQSKSSRRPASIFRTSILR